MSDHPQVKEKVCLIVIDGWGISPEENTKGDAIRNAATPTMDSLEKDFPFAKLQAHGLAVGLVEGLMGNSEVGHLNIGAGRIVYQDIVRINLALKNNEFGKTENIAKAFENAKAKNGRLHLLGLVSDGGVHSHNTHLYGLLKAAKEANVPEVYVQFFGDGRDTDPRSSKRYLQELLDVMKELDYGKVGVIVGRYYAMDRDKRWERVKLAVDALTKGEGEESSDPIQTIESRYAKDETDEFLKPIIANKDAIIRDDDTLLFFDFRADRMRQITQVMGLPDPPMEVSIPKNLHITTFTRYKSEYPFPIAFPPQQMNDVLAEWLAKQKIPQCHVAETEKYAHVTFFFNGGTEAHFEQEERRMVPSPKVATYDHQPHMSVIEVADQVSEEIASEKYPFVMCNLAPPDMVGHTGVYDATVSACEATDKAIAKIFETCQKHNYVLFITADHGNAEKMYNDEGGPHTAHTTNLVPFIMTSKKYKFNNYPEAALCDVAPTILDIMGVPLPEAMTGTSILSRRKTRLMA